MYDCPGTSEVTLKDDLLTTSINSSHNKTYDNANHDRNSGDISLHEMKFMFTCVTVSYLWIIE